MPRDPRIDAYIKKAAPWAQPILTELRAAVHAAGHDVEETMKWSSPTFDYHGIMCGFAVFKAHVKFHFWKHELVVGARSNAPGSLGHLRSVDDLPSQATLVTYVRKAMKLNAEGAKAPHMVARRAKKPLVVPAYIRTALAKDAKARSTFGAFSPSHQREYVEWITEAKTEPTREKRLATMLDWLAEGKHRNWKYER
jgi:hypothetical protein